MKISKSVTPLFAKISKSKATNALMPKTLSCDVCSRLCTSDHHIVTVDI